MHTLVAHRSIATSASAAGMSAIDNSIDNSGAFSEISITAPLTSSVVAPVVRHVSEKISLTYLTHICCCEVPHRSVTSAIPVSGMVIGDSTLEGPGAGHSGIGSSRVGSTVTAITSRWPGSNVASVPRTVHTSIWFPGVLTGDPSV